MNYIPTAAPVLPNADPEPWEDENGHRWSENRCPTWLTKWHPRPEYATDDPHPWLDADGVRHAQQLPPEVIDAMGAAVFAPRTTSAGAGQHDTSTFALSDSPKRRSNTQ